MAPWLVQRWDINGRVGPRARGCDDPAAGQGAAAPGALPRGGEGSPRPAGRRARRHWLGTPGEDPAASDSESEAGDDEPRRPPKILAALSRALGPLGRRAPERGGSSASDGGEGATAACYSAICQRQLGPQSLRGGASLRTMRHIPTEDRHAWECFSDMRRNETFNDGDFAVFYHSYSSAALIYEVQAALGALLLRFDARRAPLPRLFASDFAETSDANALMSRFVADFSDHHRDHNVDFRKVALSAMCSFAARGPELCVPLAWRAGYSCRDIHFAALLRGVFEACGFDADASSHLFDAAVALAEKHDLDTTAFGGNPGGDSGHILQIFVRRDLVDSLAYAAKPYGMVDEERTPLSQWLNGDNSFNYGQVRVLARPGDFTDQKRVKMFAFSASETFHRKRAAFQRQLQRLLGKALSEHSLRQEASERIRATAARGGA